MLFRRFMILYLTFRFFVEFIRVGHLMLWGLTGYQLACIVGIIYVYRDVWLKLGAKTLGREA
jgi:prolipoprotein diacylglyceryltransferase